jgi:hypothetical protein
VSRRILSISRIGNPFFPAFRFFLGFVPSNGESFSSLGAPSSDNVPSGLGSHSDQEAVGSLSAFVMGLEGSLHEIILYNLVEPTN